MKQTKILFNYSLYNKINFFEYKKFYNVINYFTPFSILSLSLLIDSDNLFKS